eukprot:3760892-Prorocentrum_lima.AAC.1
MTSSLVGSEMCIRDSYLSLPAERVFIVGEEGGPRRLLRCPIGVAVTTPVSYTHLTLPTICSV